MTDSNLSQEDRTYFESLGNDFKTMDDYKTKVMERATADFLDVISEYSCDLDPVEIYQCFLRAAIENKNYELKDYQKALDLAVIASSVNYETQRSA